MAKCLGSFQCQDTATKIAGCHSLHINALHQCQCLGDT